MKRPVLLAVLACASVAAAQRGPLPGLPLVPPPVNHPALLAQPLLQPDGKPAPATAGQKAQKKGQKNAGKKQRRSRPKVDPDTVGVKVSGQRLKKAIKKVTDLKWRTNLFDMKARSAATGKPILYLQALGSLKGRA